MSPQLHTGFAFSKWPHLLRTYLVSGPYSSSETVCGLFLVFAQVIWPHIIVVDLKLAIINCTSWIEDFDLWFILTLRQCKTSGKIRTCSWDIFFVIHSPMCYTIMISVLSYKNQKWSKKIGSSVIDSCRIESVTALEKTFQKGEGVVQVVSKFLHINSLKNSTILI